MSSWIERIRNYDSVVEELQNQIKESSVKEEDKKKIKRELNTRIVLLEEEKKILYEQIDETKETYEKELNALKVNHEKEIDKLKLKLQREKEEKTALASSKGGLVSKVNRQDKKIKKLESQIEFLKNNRRSPSLEELKSYTEGRKNKNGRK